MISSSNYTLPPRPACGERVGVRGSSAVGQVERVDRAADSFELQLSVIRRAHADTGAVDDGLGHLPEPGAPMNAALQHDIALLARVDAEAQQTIEVGGLDMARDQHDLDRSGVEHYRGAHIHLHAASHRSAVAVAAIRDRLDRTGHVESGTRGGYRRHRYFAADRQRDLGA